MAFLETHSSLFEDRKRYLLTKKSLCLSKTQKNKQISYYLRRKHQLLL